MKTAPQILEYYTEIDWNELHSFWWVIKEDILKAMREYARIKWDKLYEEWYKTAINQMK